VFLELDEKLIPNARQVDPFFFDFFDRKAIGFNYAPYGLFYRTDHIKTPPSSWAELWRNEHASKILLPDTTSGGAEETVVIAAMLNGGSVTNLDPGWAALRRLKANVHRFFKNNNEPVPMLQRGEASIGGWYSARVYGLKDSGVPIEFVTPSEGAPVGVLSYHVARNSPNRDAALDFINFALSKEAQEGFGNGIEYGVCNRLAELKGRAKERVTPLDKLLRIDWRKVEISKISERYRREITS
jgi:putative spermidine/putrescine transport system substrate-binding protein